MTQKKNPPPITYGNKEGELPSPAQIIYAHKVQLINGEIDQKRYDEVKRILLDELQ